MGDPSNRLPLSTRLAVVLLLVTLGSPSPALAAEGETEKQSPAGVREFETELQSAPVEIDGRTLFRVRGVSAVPADKRAAAIAERIEALAANPSVPADAVHTVESELGTAIFAANQRIMLVLEEDARLESVDRKVLAAAIADRIRSGVHDYRQARSREALVKSSTLSGAATGVFATLVVLVVWLSRRLRAALERRYLRRVHALQIQSFQIVRTEQIWAACRRFLNGLRAVLILFLSFIYVQYVLALFPWTRGTAIRLLHYLLDPLTTMGRGIVNQIPDLIFLAILYYVIRYILRLIHLFFSAVGRGEVTLSGFDPDWAESTYKLMRVGVIVFALVMAYPHIPGSRSDAFKGLSIFIGFVFSLGSSSVIANLIAGYTMTYRRAFRVGDRVKIGDTIGDVTEMRLQVTHLKTVKNEEVIVPNSAILNNEVVNYSSLARRGGLILHTKVGIGYETPWRQVEAMLRMAADRTPGLLKEPSPFVRQETLGDFAVTYEVNVYCDNAQAMGEIYTRLHQNILDVFNEYGVQIMTPAYEGDPEEQKIVHKERWFSAPAKILGTE